MFLIFHVGIQKLFHTAALHGEAIDDATHYGWETGAAKKHDWSKLVEAVQDHIGSLNWGYRVQLQEKKVTYLNAFAKLLDAHTVETTDKKKQVKKITAEHILIATGGRPKYPNIEGIEHVLTSDDIFQRFEAPGKVVVVGASYVALECAGFLAGLGYDTTVMVRSILLRGFDQECSELIGKYMREHGTKFIRPAEPTKIVKLDSGKLQVHWSGEAGSGVEECDTILYAVGRDPETKRIGLENVPGVKLASNGKIVTDNHDRTTVDNIFAIGDVANTGAGELTPVAIKAGRLLARRLYGGSKMHMDYHNIPTTIFTPLEYGCVGYSEDDAIAKFGKDNLEVYHSFFMPLEYTVAHRPENECFSKIITLKTENERVIGMHFLGPHAGEVIQGFSTGLRLGMTKEQLDMTTGIHPTVAEELIEMKITKASGESPLKSGC